METPPPRKVVVHTPQKTRLLLLRPACSSDSSRTRETGGSRNRPDLTDANRARFRICFVLLRFASLCFRLRCFLREEGVCDVRHPLPPSPTTWTRDVLREARDEKSEYRAFSWLRSWRWDSPSRACPLAWLLRHKRAGLRTAPPTSRSPSSVCSSLRGLPPAEGARRASGIRTGLVFLLKIGACDLCSLVPESCSCFCRGGTISSAPPPSFSYFFFLRCCGPTLYNLLLAVFCVWS